MPSANAMPSLRPVAAAAIDYFEEYYAQPYPGDKVDLVAVPDFAFGAMENLGCVTFREVLLLIDPDDATQADLQRVADVVNHELAHMWFGNFVTLVREIRTSIIY
jgi:puromycin-sensitive aminopeptidase